MYSDDAVNLVIHGAHYNIGGIDAMVYRRERAIIRIGLSAYYWTLMSANSQNGGFGTVYGGVINCRR